MASEPAKPKKRSYTKRPSRTSYSITLPFGRRMDVKESANAWWMEQGKVERLLAAFGIDASVEEACAYAEITARQYKYFLRSHPELKDIRQLFKSKNTLHARHTIMKELNENNDYWKGMDYLKKRVPEQFGPPSRQKKSSGYASEKSKPFMMDQYTDAWLGVVMARRNKPNDKKEEIIPEAENAIPDVPDTEEPRYVTANLQDFESKWKY